MKEGTKSTDVTAAVSLFFVTFVPFVSLCSKGETQK